LLSDIVSLKRYDNAVRYSDTVPKSRWGQAIAFHLAERGWSQRQLADKASLRPNTLTNLIKHGRDSDTATLSRIAAALQIDVAELFMTREQVDVLRLVQREVSRIARRDDAAAKRDRKTPARTRAAKR
jgi:transcriptional regulator with XRE-family HTH domain